jgi:hypothetical protein
MEISQCSSFLPHRVCYRLVAQEGWQTPPRFRTIQVCPKDLPAALRQAEAADD